eukprot:2023543-Amphidinium_carterae.1
MTRFRTIVTVPAASLTEIAIDSGCLGCELLIDGLRLPPTSAVLKPGDFRSQGVALPRLVNEPGGVRVGVHATPEEYVAEACTKDRLDLVVPHDAKQAAEWTCSSTSEDVIAARLKAIVWVKNEVRRLAADEADRHASMQPHIAKVMKGKRTLALQSILSKCGCVDPVLDHGLVHGFRLLGDIPPHPEWERKV